MCLHHQTPPPPVTLSVTQPSGINSLIKLCPLRPESRIWYASATMRGIIPTRGEHPSVSTKGREHRHSSGMDHVGQLGIIFPCLLITPSPSSPALHSVPSLHPLPLHVPHFLCSALFHGTDSGGECGVPHERRLVMPRPALDQPWSVTAYTHVQYVRTCTTHKATYVCTCMYYNMKGAKLPVLYSIYLHNIVCPMIL